MIRSQYFERSLALLLILSSMWTWIFIQKVPARRVIIWLNLIKVCLQHGSTFETTPTTSMMCGGDEVADELQCVEQWRGQSRVREKSESGFDAVSGLWSLRCSSKSSVLSTWFWSKILIGDACYLWAQCKHHSWLKEFCKGDAELRCCRIHWSMGLSPQWS